MHTNPDLKLSLCCELGESDLARFFLSIIVLLLLKGVQKKTTPQDSYDLLQKVEISFSKWCSFTANSSTTRRHCFPSLVIRMSALPLDDLPETVGHGGYQLLDFGKFYLVPFILSDTK